MRQHCEMCEEETAWTVSHNDSFNSWCSECGFSKEMFVPDNMPGGCPEHPDATHENGFGLAGGGYGPYSICNVCGLMFDKIDVPDDM